MTKVFAERSRSPKQELEERSRVSEFRGAPEIDSLISILLPWQQDTKRELSKGWRGMEERKEGVEVPGRRRRRRRQRGKSRKEETR